MSCLLGLITLKKCRSNFHVACYALSKPRSVPLLFPPTIMVTRTATPGNDPKVTYSNFSGHRQKRTLRSPPRDCLRRVRQLPQLAIQKVARSTVGEVSCCGVVVGSVMAGECMTLPRIAVYRRIWFLSNRRPNRRLRSFGDELILLGQVHENGRMKPIDLS